MPSLGRLPQVFDLDEGHVVVLVEEALEIEGKAALDADAGTAERAIERAAAVGQPVRSARASVTYASTVASSMLMSCSGPAPSSLSVQQALGADVVVEGGALAEREPQGADRE